MYGWSFQGHANSRKQIIGVNFSANSIAHMFRIIKMDVSKKEHAFHAPDNHSNMEYNVDVISNVMTFYLRSPYLIIISAICHCHPFKNELVLVLNTAWRKQPIADYVSNHNRTCGESVSENSE